jgi:DNA ligase-1
MVNDFQTLARFIEEMNSSNSTNHKVEILKKYLHTPFIVNVLQYTYHPYKQYGVTSANLKKRSDLNSSEREYSSLFDLLDALNARIITGHSAIAAANSFIARNANFANIIYQIIDRNLETRATTSLINRVSPGLIPTFNVALAHDYTKVKGINLFDGSWYVSRKLDGVRCITIIRNGEIKFFSRNGKEFDTLGRVKSQIEALGLNNCVLDGEICMMSEDGSDDFQGILKEIQRKNHTIESPRYWIFDILTLAEFDSGHGEKPLSERLKRLALNEESILILPQWRLHNEENLIELKDRAKSSGWEGLIARRNVGYEGDRTKNMLKLKEFYDAEYKVVDVVMEPQRLIVNGREVEEEVLSAVIVEHKGNPVKVGSGFSVDERREYFANPEKIVGKIINVQYFESTVDQHGSYSLRFPVFKGVYGDSREI